jgi:hypothetical protein
MTLADEGAVPSIDVDAELAHELDADPEEVERALAAVWAAVASADTPAIKSLALAAYTRQFIYPLVDAGKFNSDQARDRVIDLGRSAKLDKHLKRDGLESVARQSSTTERQRLDLHFCSRRNARGTAGQPARTEVGRCAQRTLEAVADTLN